jgi:hypothetical protein
MIVDRPQWLHTLVGAALLFQVSTHIVATVLREMWLLLGFNTPFAAFSMWVVIFRGAPRAYGHLFMQFLLLLSVVLAITGWADLLMTTQSLAHRQAALLDALGATTFAIALALWLWWPRRPRRRVRRFAPSGV